MNARAFVVLAAMTGVAAADAPAMPERLISYQQQDALVVARLTKAGPRELFRQAAPKGLAYMSSRWVDARQLVLVIVEEDRSVEVKWVVDGAVDGKRTVKHGPKAWGLGDEPEIKAVGGEQDTFYTPDGGLWLDACLRLGGGADYTCKSKIWMRVDKVKPTVTRDAPSGAIPFYPVEQPTPIAAPAGLTAKLASAPGARTKRSLPSVECSGPSAKSTYNIDNQGESFTPAKIRWLVATPPIYGVDGSYTSMGGAQKLSFYFKACDATPLEDFVAVGDGLWAITTGRNVTVHFGDQAVAVIAGTNLRSGR